MIRVVSSEIARYWTVREPMIYKFAKHEEIGFLFGVYLIAVLTYPLVFRGVISTQISFLHCAKQKSQLTSVPV